MSSRIAIVLPRKEAFARDRFGAIALTVEAYVRHSRYRDATEILGIEVAAPRDLATFRAIAPRDAWWRRRNLGFAAGCADHLAEVRPTHIDVHNRVEVFFYLAKRFPDAAVSLWFHNDPQDTRGAYTARARQHILARASLVVGDSDWVRRRFLDGVGGDGMSGDAGRAIVLPEGYDALSVTPTPKEKTILYVGRIIPEKGVLALARALTRALPELPDWRAAIVGGPRRPGTPYLREVEEAVAPLRDRIALPGFVPHEETAAAFARAAIAVVPSQWEEAFGRTALEAMAAGCATIATPRGGLAELVGDAGMLVEPSEEALAAAIVALARNDERRARLQRAARERAVAEFDIRRWAARLDDLR